VTHTYDGSASLQHLTPTALGGNGTEPLSYAVYPNPNGVSAGEPSCGVDWKTKKVMYQAGLTTLRVSFNDCSSPATAKWEDVSFSHTSLVSLDAILFTDRFTNRTFVDQLSGQDSLSAFTDDDGTTWDAQPGRWHSLRRGPRDCRRRLLARPHIGHASLLKRPTARVSDAVYYCSQDIATAFCARSDDGGLTYGAGVPTWTLADCGGLHGHVKYRLLTAPSMSQQKLQRLASRGCFGKQRRDLDSEKSGRISAGIWDPQSASPRTHGVLRRRRR